MRFSIMTQQASSLTLAAHVVDQRVLDSLTRRRAIARERLDQQIQTHTAHVTTQQAHAKAQLRKALGYSE